MFWVLLALDIYSDNVYEGKRMNWKERGPLSFASYKGKALGMFRMAKKVTEKILKQESR